MTANVGDFRLTLLGREVLAVDCAKDLGVMLDSNLTYRDHVESTVRWFELHIMVNDSFLMTVQISLSASTLHRHEKPPLHSLQSLLHVNHMMLRLQYSGYDRKFRKEVVRSALAAYNRLVELDANGEQPLYRPREWRALEPARERKKRRDNWFRKGDYDTVIFVPATTGSQIKRRYMIEIKATEFKIKVVEQSGTTLKAMLKKSNPFKQRRCTNADCLLCRTDRKGSCRSTGITLELIEKGRTLYLVVQFFNDRNFWKTFIVELIENGRTLYLVVRFFNDRNFWKTFIENCRQVHMNPTVQDFFLEKHVFKMMEIETASACEVNCFIEADCISYNLKPQRNEKYLCELSDSDYETNPKDFSARSIINEGNLTILNITTQDNGSYLCTATNPWGTKSSSVHLRVYSALKFCNEGVLGPPLVRVVPDIIETVEGRNVTAMCNVTANPKSDRITWNKSDGIISSAKGIVNEGDLTILNITTLDNGSYVCTAANLCGTKSSTVHIRVYSALDFCTEGPPLVRVVPDIIETLEGRNVTVMCNVTANPKPDRITWNKSDGIISGAKGIVNEGNLTILNVTSQDNGSYVCTARNPCGTKSSSVYLLVYSAPNFCTEGVLGPPLVRVFPEIIESVEGRNVTAICSVIANPKPSSIIWKKSDGVHLRVYSSLKFAMKPPSNVTVKAYDSLILPCSVSSEVTPTILWMYDGTMSLPSGAAVDSLNSLTVSSASFYHSGTYTCKATNALSSVQSSVVVYVTDYPKTCTSVKTNISDVSGDYFIDPDGAPGEDPFPVYCNMTDKEGVGVTVVGHDSENRTQVKGFDDPGAAVESFNVLVVPSANVNYGGIFTYNATDALSSVQTSVIVYVMYPKTCTSVKVNISDVRGDYFIDLNGFLGEDPFSVYCNMTDERSLGVTVVGHDSENRTQVDGFEDPGEYSPDVHYISASFIFQLKVLTEASDICQQFIKYECFHARRLVEFGFSWWISRDGEKMT
ncbi:Hemicentin-1 [Stylophora pistillata]|uniref:Hemicentin-1 n=1 Tax=Stylophora pistillata TaxID=50429 RepID=A0A2B4SNU2_STYPI|nr:Hemicentin-1 [Stylophora pistillata]